MRTKRTKPRQAMSPREVDRVEREVRWVIDRLRTMYEDSDMFGRRRRTGQRRLFSVRMRLLRLLASIQRSERR